MLSLDLIMAFMVICEYRRGNEEKHMELQEAEQITADAAMQDQVTARKIAITFDDGPNPSYTPKLLDGLRERGVHATFFLMGQNAEAYPEIVKTMHEDGHLIGNHTYTHMQLTERDADAFELELQKTDALIFEITGEHTEYVRPPFGVWDTKYEKKLNMLPVLWTIDPRDWCTSNTDTVINRVTKAAEENGIILLHDCYASSVEAALRIIDILTEQGYEFVTVDEIIME